MNNNLEWEIQGYLLGNPEVDAVEFERRMLDDERLALLVADEVARLDDLRAVLHSADGVIEPLKVELRPVATGVTDGAGGVFVSGAADRVVRFGRRLITGLVCMGAAAALLVAAGLIELPGRDEGAVIGLGTSGGELAQVADFWIGLESEEELKSAEVVFQPTLFSSVDYSTESEQVDSEQVEADWVMEIAPVYFEEFET